MEIELIWMVFSFALYELDMKFIPYIIIKHDTLVMVSLLSALHPNEGSEG